jgi:hypothetical protein
LQYTIRSSRDSTGRRPAPGEYAPVADKLLRVCLKYLADPDLRHAAVPPWLNSGVPATEFARRARHGVAVLLKTYAHCIDGQADAANQRITDVLGTKDAGPEPGSGQDGDTKQAS